MTNDRNFRTRAQEQEKGLGGYVREGSRMVAEAALEGLDQHLTEEVFDVESLRVIVPTPRGILGVGSRVTVPANEIHVVTAGGWSSNPATLDKTQKVYGSAAGQPSVYWMNGLTVVVAMKTVNFVVPVIGNSNQGVQVLDSNRVPYMISAHVMARLNTEFPVLAAERVGVDIEGFIKTIEQVVEAQLLDAAAELPLADVIKNRLVLAEKAQETVNKTLADLGYTLAFIKISSMGGDAYNRLVDQAKAEIERDTTISTNRAQLATFRDNEERERTEAVVDKDTSIATATQQLEGERAIETARVDSEEVVAQRKHQLDVAQVTRNEELALAKQKLQLKQVALDNETTLAQKEADADQAQTEQSRAKALQLKAAEDDAARMDFVQQRDLARNAEKARQDAERFAQEQQAQADREKLVTLTAAKAAAESLKINTEASAAADSLKATTEAATIEKQAAAKTKAAEALRAEEAAKGLAAEDVRSRRLENEATEVTVAKDKGLAEAEVAQKAAEVEVARIAGLNNAEIERLKQMALLLQGSPELMQLELLRQQQAHAEKMAEIEAKRATAIAQIMAPQMHVQANLIGDGGKTSAFMAQMMSIATGMNAVGQQVPLVGSIIGTNSDGDMISTLSGLLPLVRKTIAQMEPGVMSTLTLSGLLDAVATLASGDTTKAIEMLRDNAQFKMIANVPAAMILNKLGIAAA